MDEEAKNNRLGSWIKCPCGRVVTYDKAVHCACHKYGSLGHEEEEWCSVACMERAHPESPDIED